MPNKISRYCNGIMEAAWLAAIILIPVFFNIYSSRIFEPDKITLIRSLALLTLGAWLVKLAEERRVRWERIHQKESFLKTVLSIPLIMPVLAVGVMYLISTVFSVTPRISLLGSYQRLQGTYTTLSYLVLFAAMVVNLRQRAQVDRFVTTVILASLPIALYGVLQRYDLDPIPWGGNVSVRIAANMGNSIFVAAYLIMVFPLTMGRIVDSFRAILRENERLPAHVARATVYVFVASLQVIALYMSGSRGPALGWMAGTFFLFLLLSLEWRKRWLTIAIVGLAALGAGLLLLFNIPDGPFQSLRASPAIGRFGRLLDTESNTARVRQYIWEGTYDLVMPHEPLQYPDGREDMFNFLRPLIGYGPESMYVAYNPFYPPLLGHVERRNASPDRSHNETWDALVINGALGLFVYLFLFLSVFYYGFKWLGLVQGKQKRNLYLGLSLGGGMAGGIALTLIRGIEYAGVGVPFGIAIGLIVYLALVALVSGSQPSKTATEAARSLTLIVLISAIMAHFIEINFGIAIASTRTYFFTYTALLLVVGHVMRPGEYEVGSVNAVSESDSLGKERGQPEKMTARSKRRRGEKSNQLVFKGLPSWAEMAITGGLVIAVLLVTLGFNYITNGMRSTSALEIIQISFSRLIQKNNAVSYGILALVLTTWVAAVVVWVSESHQTRTFSVWIKAFGVTLGVAGGAALTFWIMHANRLAALAKVSPSNESEIIQQVGQIGGLLTGFYLFILLCILVLARFLLAEGMLRSRTPLGLGAVLAPVVALLVAIMINSTNLRVIHADMAFKMAEPFTRGDQWPVATLLYTHALELAPNEDHYYLFLGRSYLEQAKFEDSPEGQENLVRKAEQDLKKAQRINPLNTDHTANLGRLYSWWASRTNDAVERIQRAEIASDYYARAVELSRNNSTLWGEWAILFLDVLRQPEQALERLQHALELDAEYNWTQGLMGDYYARIGRTSEDVDEKNQLIEKAIYHYKEAAKVSRRTADQSLKIGYLISIGNMYNEWANLDPNNVDSEKVRLAIEAYQEAVDQNPPQDDLYRIEEQIARLYVQIGDKASGLAHANAALVVAPDNQLERLKTLVAQIQALP